MKITNISIKEGAGWVAKELTLEGSQYPIKMFESHSLYETVAIGDDVEVDKSGKYWNVVDPKGSQRKAAPARGGMKAAQERKEQMIKDAQERKNESVAYFNSVNSAIGLVTKFADFETFDNSTIHRLIQEERDWFLSEWKKYEAGDYTEKHDPF